MFHTDHCVCVEVDRSRLKSLKDGTFFFFCCKKTNLGFWWISSWIFGQFTAAWKTQLCNFLLCFSSARWNVWWLWGFGNRGGPQWTNCPEGSIWGRIWSSSTHFPNLDCLLFRNRCLCSATGCSGVHVSQLMLYFVFILWKIPTLDDKPTDIF